MSEPQSEAARIEQLNAALDRITACERSADWPEADVVAVVMEAIAQRGTLTAYRVDPWRYSEEDPPRVWEWRRRMHEIVDDDEGSDGGAP